MRIQYRRWRNNTYEMHAAESLLCDYIRLPWMPKVKSGFLYVGGIILPPVSKKWTEMIFNLMVAALCMNKSMIVPVLVLEPL